MDYLYQSLSFSIFADPIFADVAAPSLDGRGWQVILVTLMSSSIAQVLKVIIKLLTTGKLDMRMVATTGGMPSSHSSCTMGMAVSVGLIEGFNSV